MIKNQVTEETIVQWDKLKVGEAAPLITLANAQSLFLQLKHGERITEATHVDQKLVEEVKELKASLKTRDDERRRAVSKLQSVTDKHKSVILEAKKVKYKSGWTNGVKDFIKSTIEVFPDFDWSKLGEDTAKEAEKVKAEKTADAAKNDKDMKLKHKEIKHKALKLSGGFEQFHQRYMY
ncbi:hypothetical protein AgCh_017487 [Apium graveolens]